MPHVEPLVELIFFAGCPHVEPARAALRIARERAAWRRSGRTGTRLRPEAPAHAHGLGSPTILVDGRDVTGASTRTTGRACRADGVPAPEVIIAALAGPSAR